MERARELESRGLNEQALALRVLGGTISLHLRHASHEPFGPYFTGPDGRSMALEDLGEHDIDLLAKAARDATDPLLRARFADVAITADARTPKDWRLGVIAVQGYLDYADATFGTDWAIDAVDGFKRGLVLARVYAKRDDALWARFWELARREAPASIARGAPGVVFRLCEEAMERSRETCEALVPLLREKAESLVEQSPQEAARWFEQAHRMYHRLRNRSDANAMLLAQGEALVAAAGHSAAHQPMLAPLQLTEAISLLRRGRADPSRIVQLRDVLAHYERASLEAYGHIEHRFDASDIVRWVEAQIEAPTFAASLLRMAFRIGRWLDPDEIEARVRQSAREHPLSHMFSSTFANQSGAIVSRRPAFNESDPAVVERFVFASAVEIDLNMRSTVVVPCAAQYIQFAYQPSFLLVKEIVEASIVAPRAHLESLARGLHAGFSGDLLSVSAYLIPAMEPFIRHELQRRGVHTMVLEDDGTQRERTLGEMLSMPEANDVFGRKVIFEFRAHLTDPDGLGLRNGYCHGLLSDDRLDGPSAWSLWWFVWRLILIPWHDHPDVLVPPSDPAGLRDPDIQGLDDDDDGN